MSSCCARRKVSRGTRHASGDGPRVNLQLHLPTSHTPTRLGLHVARSQYTMHIYKYVHACDRAECMKDEHFFFLVRVCDGHVYHVISDVNIA